MLSKECLEKEIESLFNNFFYECDRIIKKYNIQIDYLDFYKEASISLYDAACIAKHEDKHKNERK